MENSNSRRLFSPIGSHLFLAAYPLYAELRKVEEEQQYKTPPNLCHLIAQTEAGLILVVTWCRV